MPFVPFSNQHETRRARARQPPCPGARQATDSRNVCRIWMRLQIA